MSAIAIIPARGGSKRIPRKNIRLFLDRPIIAYSIAAALESGLFDEVMVSTDDEEIAAVARESGAKVPFLRSSATSGDHSTTAEVLTEVFDAYSKDGRSFDLACCIYPTAPFVTGDRLRAAFDRLRSSGAECVMPVTRFSPPIWRSFEMDGERLRYRWPEHALTRSQDLPPAFYDAGQFYAFDVARFGESRSLVGPDTIGIDVPESGVQDIDSDEDWRLAELKYRLLAEKSASQG